MKQKAYKFRIYPTVKQKRQLAVEFCCARWVWNAALDARSHNYKNYGESNNYVSLNRAITEVKKDAEFSWLKGSTAGCLTQKLIDLDKAYNSFFKGKGFPKFKKKSNKQSVRYQLDQRQDNFKSGEYLKLSKIGKIKIKWDRIPKGRPKMATVSKDSDGKYYISFMCKESIKPKAKTKRTVGVDVGIKDVLVTSDGFYSGAPKFTYQYARELKLAQRKLSRKKKGSNRYQKQRVKVARIHSKIGRCRRDFLNKLSHKLVSEYDLICIEDLNVSGMMKNRCLSKAVADVGMFELKRQLEYKADWYGKEVVQISRWFPSTRTCSNCGQAHDMPLKKRIMSCDCGLELDRDLNAAINIMTEGQRIQVEGIRSLSVKLDTSLTAKPLAA